MTRYLIPPTPPEDLPPPPPTAQDFNIPDEAYGAHTLFGALQPGEQLAPEYWDEVNRANSTRAAELQNQFLDKQREILHTGPDAYLNKTGRDAVLAAPDVLARLEAVRQDTIGQGANDAQRRLLTSALGEHRITEHYRVGTHAGEQSLEWQKQTATERLNQLRQQAALDHADLGSIEAYARASESAARERARTLKFRPDSPEASREIEGAQSSIWRRAIEAALDKIDTKSAIILYNQAADRITPTESGVLAPQIDAAKEHQAAQDYLAKLSIPDTHDLGELDTAHQSATTQNEADWPTNDSQRTTNQHFIERAFAEKKGGIVRAKAELDQSVKDWLSRPSQTQRPPLAAWTSLNPEERSRVDDELKRNVEKNADHMRAPDDASPEAVQMRPIRHLGRELWENLIPGAHYENLAHQALSGGHYGEGVIYGVAWWLDAFMGALSLGMGTELSGAVRTAIDASRAALERALRGTIKAVEEAAVAAGARLRRSSTGEFSIIDWTGYPEYLPKPAGPFRLIDGVEYRTNRDLADKINRAWRRRDPLLKDKEVHEIHTIKFGGNPNDQSNKIPLSVEEHRAATEWWRRLQYYMETAR